MRISGNNSTLHKGGHKAQSTGTDGGDNHLSSDDNSSLPLAVSPRDGLVKGAAVLGICGFIGKLLGAVYRIPLTNALGAEGMGLYQMVFPMYALLLTVSSSGLPSAISRLVAERAALNDREGGGRVLGAAAVTLAVFGALGAVCGYFFGGRIAGV
ncbi:MAG: oligosaccharide flippase family protein, partial [Firmicutes bacterium]|nr:oligosaccharide flippase family protein [Bacillota bacterium]